MGVLLCQGPGVGTISLWMLSPTGWVPTNVCIPTQFVSTQVTLGVIKQLADCELEVLLLCHETEG